MVYRIVVDQSTTNTKAILFEIEGNGRQVNRVDRVDIPHKQIYPKKGFVEHNPKEIIENTIKVIDAVIDNNKLKYSQIKSISITNQRETILIWDKITGKTYGNAMVWKCNRGIEICEKLIENGFEDLIRNKTGLKIDPYFSASKLAHFFKNNKISELEKKNLAIGTMDSWLIWNLSKEGNFYTEESNACRTLLFDIRNKIWNEELCKIFDVPIDALPKVVDSNTDFGTYKGIKISSVLADSQSALLGNKCLEEGQIKATLGTGSSMLLNFGNKICKDERIVTTIAWNKNGKTTYALEGIIKSYGDILNWGKNKLNLFSSYDEASKLALEDNNKTDVIFVPAIQGLSAPFWKPKAKGAFLNMSITSTKKDLIKAMFDSLAFQTRSVIDLYSEVLNKEIEEIFLDGGSTKNPFFMQLLADVTQKKLFVMDIEEASALGTLVIMDGMENYTPKVKKEYIPTKSYERQYIKWKEIIKKIF